MVDFDSCCCFLKEELAFFFGLFGANLVARDEADLTEVAKTGKEKEEEDTVVVEESAMEVEAKV